MCLSRARCAGAAPSATAARAARGRPAPSAQNAAASSTSRLLRRSISTSSATLAISICRMFEMSSVHRVSSDVSCVPSRVCTEKTRTKKQSVTCQHFTAPLARSDSEGCARLEVLSVPVDVGREGPELLERLLDVLGRRFRQVVVYPPRVRPVLLHQRQVRVPARPAFSVRRQRVPSRAYLSLWCSSCARAFFSAASHSSSFSGFVGAGSW